MLTITIFDKFVVLFEGEKQTNIAHKFQKYLGLWWLLLVNGNYMRPLPTPRSLHLKKQADNNTKIIHLLDPDKTSDWNVGIRKHTQIDGHCVEVNFG